MNKIKANFNVISVVLKIIQGRKGRKLSKKRS